MLLVSAALLAAALPLGSGCGSGSGTQPASALPAGQRTGRATVTLVWPAPPAAPPTRLIPAASNSVRVALKRGGSVVAERLLVRPPSGSGETTATFDDLPLGELSAEASAHPNGDGTGVAQARAAAPVTVNPGANSPLRLALGSTIDRVAVSPAEAEAILGASGPPVAFTATAYDADGNVVLVAPGAFRFESDAPGVAGVGATDGVVAPVTLGGATVAATEAESGRAGSARLRVARGGAYRVVEVPLLTGADGGKVTGMNSKGEVVGYCTVGGVSTTMRPFLWKPGPGGTLPGTLTELPTLPNRRFEPRDINTAGQVAGIGWSTTSGGSRAVLYAAGAVRDLGDGTALGINESGQVVGAMPNPDTTGGLVRNLAFVWRDGQPRKALSLPPPRGVSIPSSLPSSRAEDINDSGMILGYYWHGTNLGPFAPCRWQNADAAVTALVLPPEPPGVTLSDARPGAINAEGTAVGYVNRSGAALVPGDVVFWGPQQPDRPRVAIQPGSFYGFGALDINAAGMAVGVASAVVIGTPFRQTAARWRYNAMEPLDGLIPAGTGWTLAEAGACNDSGWIAGNGTRDDRAALFLLVPQGGGGGLDVGVR